MQPLSDSLRGLYEKIEASRKASLLRQAERPSEQSQAKALQAGRQRIQASLRDAGVPDYYSDATWERVRSPAVKAWADDVKLRCRRRSEEDAGPPVHKLWGHGLFLFGPPGTGKSSAMGLVARSAVEAGRTVLWRYVPDMCDTLTSGAQNRATEIRRVSSVDLLLLDDFGVRDLPDWEIGFLDQIMEARYRNRRPVVITTNLTGTQLREDARLERMTERWRERLASNALTLTGASMRNTNPERPLT